MYKLPPFEQGLCVPKLIHQTFQTKNLPPDFEHNVENLIALNPGWVHKIYDDADIVRFIDEHYDITIKNYYFKINPRYGAARADFFRYLLLYKFGGVYLDIKSTISKPLDSILKPGDQYLLTQWENKAGDNREGWGKSTYLGDIPGGEFQQWHIVAAAGHPFLKSVIERILNNIDHYNPWIHGTGGNGVLRLTGPIAYTLAIFPLMPYYSHRLTTDREIGFEYTIFKSSSHKPLFKFHYTKLTESIIRLNGLAYLSAQIYSIAKQSKRKFLEIINK